MSLVGRHDNETVVIHLHLEVELLTEVINRFLDGDAPTVCNRCHEKLQVLSGFLRCRKCKSEWDPRTGEWSWKQETHNTRSEA